MKVEEKIAFSLHPPKCPGCGRGITGLIETDFGSDFENAPIHYHCRRCGALIAKNVEDAKKFMKGEE